MADQPLAETETIYVVTRTITYNIEYKEDTPQDVLDGTTEYGDLQYLVEIGSGSPHIVSATTDKEEKVTRNKPQLPDFENMSQEEMTKYVAQAFGLSLGELDAAGLSLSI